MGSIFRVRRPGGRPAMAPPPPPWCHLANQHPREMPGNISFLSLRAVALQPLIERVMLKMKALPLRLVHALDACAPRTTHGRSSHLNSDPHVAAINITALAQPFDKGRQRPPIARSRIGVKKSDHRHRRLLRARRERPRSRRATEERDEVAPFHCPMPPVLATKRIAHLSHGRGLLRCGISIQPAPQQKNALVTLFDHPVGACQYYIGYRDAKCFCRP